MVQPLLLQPTPPPIASERKATKNVYLLLRVHRQKKTFIRQACNLPSTFAVSLSDEVT
jgi:hypothetical protein